MAHAATRPAPTPTIRSVATATVRVVANGRDIGCPMLAIVVSAFCHWSGRVCDPLLCGIQKGIALHGYLVQGPMAEGCGVIFAFFPLASGSRLRVSSPDCKVGSPLSLRFGWGA